jgi:hypothetical protein
MGETYSLSRRQLEHMRAESAMRRSMAGEPAWREYPPPPKPPRITVFVPPATGSPIMVATAFLAYELGSKPAPVAALMAGAARHGIKESTLRRAKKSLNIKTIERDDGFYWAFPVHVEP